MYEVLPEDFQTIRKATGLGVTAFAKSVGLTRGMVYKIEDGTSLPSLYTLAKIATLYGVHFELGPNPKHPLLQSDDQADA